MIRAGALFLITLCLLGNVLPARAADPSTSFSSVEIDQVEILGVTLLEATVAESALELYPGDKLDRVRVLRTVRNMQELYRAKGYEKVRIESELQKRKVSASQTETILIFNVQEGKPSRVANIKIIPVSGDTEKESGFQEYWAKISPQLYSKTQLVSGDLLDLEKIASAKRAIQDQLASDEYIGAKVLDVVALDAREPEQSSVEAARWVNIEFKVDLGDRVVFGFRGNAVLTRAQLSSLIEEQRLNGLGRDYINIIRDRIEAEYQSLGFSSVEVKPFTFENPERREKYVTYQITEGMRTRIESVVFAGNEFFGQEELVKQFNQIASERVQFGFYVGKDVQSAADALVDWIKNQGFLSAKLVTMQRVFSVKKDSVKIMIYLFEGDRTFVREVKIQGLQAYNHEEVLEILNTGEDRPINLSAYSKGLETLKGKYRAQGYLDFKITNETSGKMIQYSDQNRFADIYLEIEEGIRYRVSRIEIEGLTRTHDIIVKRELMIQVGDYLEEAKVIETEERLRKLGIFSNISIKALDDETQPGHKILKVTVQEGSPGYIAGGPGYRNDLGVRLFAQTGYSNLWRRNHTISLNATANQRAQSFRAGRTNFVEYQTQLGYVWPWWLDFKEVSFRPRITVERTQYIAFSASSVAGAVVWDKRLLRRLNLIGSLTYSLERTIQFDADKLPDGSENIDNQTLRIGAITPSLRLDMRDNPLSPSKGLYATTSFEFAHPAFLSQSETAKNAPVAYTRFQSRIDQFIPITSGISWYVSFRNGFARNLAVPPAHAGGNTPDQRLYAIPLVKQFALGGPSSLRGYGNQEINYYRTTAIRGTLSYVNYRTQIDFPVSGAMKVGPFLDAANLLVDTFSFGDLRWGTGLGMHYQTPIGPINFDWGFKIFPRPGEAHSNQIIFSVGVI